MKALPICMLALALSPGLAMAGGKEPHRSTANSPDIVYIEDLAAASGLHPRQVQMVLGASTAFSQYKATHARVERRFIAAVGQARYDDLLAGRIRVATRGPSTLVAVR